MPWRGGRGTYRVAEIGQDDLWRVVEDTAGHRTTRIGAAVALRENIDVAGRERLRRVAESCAAPRMRVAFETIAYAESEDELLAALEKFEDEPRPR